MSNDVEHAKRALRAELRERRQLLSDPQREAAAAAIGVIAGLGVDSYVLALEAMVARLRKAKVSGAA